MIEIIDILRKEYPHIRGTALNYTNPLELLIATILSAQTTDERVNMVTKEFFKKYKNADEFAKADINELENYIKSVNFYKNKARYIKECCKIISEKYAGKVPDSMQDLLSLPGVSRKTANVVLSNAFRKDEGIVVDTHVIRLSQRIGLTDEKNRDKIEEDLMKKFPKDKWFDLSNLLIAHGRKICKAKNPICEKCVLNRICRSAYEHRRRNKKN
ncbi:MAG: endonuclease III [Candidatus Thermoplasmatota archaeon]